MTPETRIAIMSSEIALLRSVIIDGAQLADLAGQEQIGRYLRRSLTMIPDSRRIDESITDAAVTLARAAGV